MCLQWSTHATKVETLAQIQIKRGYKNAIKSNVSDPLKMESKPVYHANFFVQTAVLNMPTEQKVARSELQQLPANTNDCAAQNASESNKYIKY